MSNDQPGRSGTSRSDALRGALANLAVGQRLAVRTAAGEEVRGIFRSLEGETLVLARAPYDEHPTPIPFATIVSVDRVDSHGRAGAGFAIALALIPFFWLLNLTGEWHSELGGFALVIVFAGIVGIVFAASIGAVIGAAFDSREPLVVTKHREG
ncbi:MAG TPA: hypothetical protein VHM30_13585 [Gemmatimonadaceae bacterium]|nr:hypothetical protein [Gemmatimonadaceae bacterium]